MPSFLPSVDLQHLQACAYRYYAYQTAPNLGPGYCSFEDLLQASCFVPHHLLWLSAAFVSRVTSVSQGYEVIEVSLCRSGTTDAHRKPFRTNT